MNNQTNNDLSLRREFGILWRKKKLILIVTIISGIIAVVLSSPPITEPEYKAEAIFIPPSLSNVKALNYYKDIFGLIPVGTRADVERLVEVLESYNAYLYVKQKFPLKELYEIEDSPEDKLLEDKNIYKAYQGHVDISITPFEAVSIEVWDKNPEMAAKIAARLLEYADSFVESIAKRREGLKNVKESIKKLMVVHRQLTDSIDDYRKKYKIFDFRDLSETATKEALRYANKYPDEFYKNYDWVVAIEKLIAQQNSKISQLIQEQTFREENLKTYPTLLDIIEQPYPSKNYKRPKRLIVALTTMIIVGFIFSVIILIIDKIKNG